MAITKHISCLLDHKQLQRIHTSALQILSQTGMRIDCSDYYGPLGSRGAHVDKAKRVVRFPSDLVEEVVDQIRTEIKAGARQNILNGVVASKCLAPVKAKFGGACVEFLDWESKEVREPTHEDLIDILRLGEALPEVTCVGNPVVCLYDEKGNRVEPRMQRIVTAATVAKYTRKCSSTEVWNEKELELLIEIGTIVRGSYEEYLSDPCFITAKETVSPLQFPEDDGRILLLLARKGLPCTIIPMPLSGMSSPVTVAGNVAITVAEVLGVMTALKVAEPQARCGGAVISGVLDMKTAIASFSAPEALLQDLTAGQVFEDLYGQDFGVGTGYIDAKIPGAESLFEKYAKMLGAAMSGRFNYPVGILNGGKRFSPEEALIEIEIARYIDRTVAGIEVDDTTLVNDLIDKVGIGGNFISEEHTAANFRSNVFLSELIRCQNYASLQEECDNDIIVAAVNKKKNIVSQQDPYEIERERSLAIDEVVRKAEKVL